MIEQLHANRFKQAEFERTVYLVTVEDGHKYESIFKPEYWAHIAQRLKPMDRIEVYAETGEYFAELMVIDAGRSWAKVTELRYVELTEATRTEDSPESELSGYSIKWMGPHHKFAVVRESDGEKVQTQLASKPAAEAWLREHLKAVAA